MNISIQHGLAALSLACAVAGAQASPWPLQALSSVGAWEASTNGTDWVPAVSVQNPYSTPVVVTNRVDAQGQVTGTQWSRDANLADFMWHPAVNGQPPLSVLLRLTFTIDLLGSDQLSMWFGADDYASVTLNGHALDSYLLDANMNASGQPTLHHLSLDRAAGLTTRDDPWGDGVGLNTLLIQAQDGGAATPFRRGLSWVFVDGYNIGDVVGNEVVGLYGRSVALVAPGQIPEPAGAALVGLALVGLVATRKGRPVPQGS